MQNMTKHMSELTKDSANAILTGNSQSIKGLGIFIGIDLASGEDRTAYIKKVRGNAKEL